MKENDVRCQWQELKSQKSNFFYESEGKREVYSCELFEFASDLFGG